MQAQSGDIPGDIFGDGDIPGDIFWNEDFHAQDTLACARCTGRFDAPKNGPLRRILWEERPETLENDRLAHLRARHAMRVCFAGVSMLSGNPYHEQRARRRCSDARPPVLVVPTNDANRFRFGNSSAFPNRRHGDHRRR